MTHMLNARTLHDLAPGILDVVHGPDGDFEGAPMWRGPLYGPAYGYTPGWWYIEGFEDGDFVTADGVTAGTYMLDYDCRVPSVAARLIWLCGLALGYNGPLYCYESHDEDCNGVKHDDCCWYLLASRAHECGAYYWQKNFSTEAAFIASMTLALAPKIAALGGSRG